MAMSEYEQQQLHEIEVQLNSDDPRFAKSLRTSRWPARKTLGLTLFIVGMLTLSVGIAVLPWLRLVGLALALMGLSALGTPSD